jgi:hypothetical protein
MERVDGVEGVDGEGGWGRRGKWRGWMERVGGVVLNTDDVETD